MKSLIKPDERVKLLENGRQTRKDSIGNHWPVVMLEVPELRFVWLLSELYPDDPDVAFGLCDLGMGFPEIGSVSLFEITYGALTYGLRVRRNEAFKADKSLLEYSALAHEVGRIVV